MPATVGAMHDAWRACRVACCQCCHAAACRPTTFETAGQADKKRVVAMVEEACHVVEMRRLTFKETPVPAATCSVQRCLQRATCGLQRSACNVQHYHACATHRIDFDCMFRFAVFTWCPVVGYL